MRRPWTGQELARLAAGCAIGCACLWAAHARAGEFRAGAAAVDISPRALPAVRNGGFLEATSDKVDDPLHARCLALSDGGTTLAIAIVDSCMVPRDVCDAVKAQVAKACGIPPQRSLIAATHTHSAPSLMDYCLGSRKDPAYAEFFIPAVAAGIAQAHARLEPAAAAWVVAQAPQHTHSRRWMHRPDAYQLDPFGEQTVRAMMHPGYVNPAYLGPSGPVDAGLTALSVQSAAGRPIAVLANYSMHYFGAGAGFSADYFGEFARHLEDKLAHHDPQAPPVVGIMSQGTSGDLHWMDYAQPQRKDYPRSQYAAELGELALAALAGAKHRRDVDLAMAETRLTLSRRLPSPERLKWAAAVKAKQATPRPANLAEVYAEQAEWLAAHPQAELVLQAVRIGELGLTAIPNEVFAITGLKLKAQSPLVPLANLELANGAEGYIPPVEQHYLGGYTTWPARTAGLEVGAEARIVAALLDLLEQVSGRKRRASSEDFYTPAQKEAIEQARRDDNNRANRGVAQTRTAALHLRDQQAADADRIRPLHARLAPPKPGDWLAEHREAGQTFAQYVKVRPADLGAARNTIYLVPLGALTDDEQQIVGLLTEYLELFYDMRVKRLAAIAEDQVPDSARRRHPVSDEPQFDSMYIIDKLLPPLVPRDAAAVVALTRTDLWPGNDWNFVLGQGSFGRPTGVVSLSRLSSPRPQDRFLQRTLKIATHEIGHLFGMPHCTAYECAMNGANSLQETDRHPLAFCPECEAKVWLVGRADPAERYRRLAAFARRNGLEVEAQLWTKSAAAVADNERE